MAETPLEMVSRLAAKIRRRKDQAKKWSDYYNGEHPLRFLSPEFEKVYGPLFEGFTDNWCQVIVDSTNERLMPLGFRLKDGTLDDSAWDAWRRNECDVEFSLASLEALVSKRAYGMVWKPEDETEITFLDTSEAVVEYVPGKRRKRAAGFRMWHDHSHEYGVLFLPDAVFWVSRDTRGGGAWSLDDSGPNPLGVVPIVPLENRARLYGKPISEVAQVAPLQDSINALWVHLMAASDDRALPTRVVMGMDRPTREIVDDEGEVIGEEDLPLDPFRANRLLWFEADGATIGEYSAADLSTFTNTLGVAVKHIAAQTRTPAHYLLGDMVNVSADALTALESGLVAKVQERQRFFGASLREIMRLEALASGDAQRAEDLALGEVVWRDAQFRSEAQYADALTKYKAINVPDERLWEMIPGVSPSEVERWKTMRTDQAAAVVGGDLASMFGPKPDPQATPEPVQAQEGV
ncbi:phage portal protein [Streptomyces sp. R08]|uniref:Phage portal protein n=1 Tax=Streptomyces sp. R08 TaxID=3238624 RepID=A0AB39MI83_9ACTN